jgi:hypothetical protein
MPPKIKKVPDDKSTVAAISKKIKDFIKHNKLAVASSATATAALAITIGYVLAITTGRGNYLMGQSDAIINETNKFIAENGQQLIDYFTQMESTAPSKINTFVRSVLNKLGHYIVYIPFTSFEGLSGGKLTEDSPSFTDRVKKTLKSIGKTLYDAAISETGQEIGKGVLLTLILAGIAYGLGPRAASVANAMIGNIQSGPRNEPAVDVPMSNRERFYWESVKSIIHSNLDTTKEANVLRNMRRERFPDYATYHRNRPEMMAAILSGKGLKDTGGGVTDYLKDKAYQAHKYIMSEDGKTLGKTALTALLLAAISKGVTDAASYEMYEYADKPNKERGMYNKYRENKSMRSAARWANEHRKEDGYFNDPDIRL